LSDIGIGSLAVGRTVAAVKDSCYVVRDISELSTEGTAERVLTILIGGDTVKATVVDGLIWRIGVNRSRFATPDGFRVGTPLSRFIAVKGVVPAEGEDGLYLLLPSHCGLSFRFTVPSRSPKGQPWTASELASRHGSSLVNRILITRCIH
jgi:hypothetical protein